MESQKAASAMEWIKLHTRETSNIADSRIWRALGRWDGSFDIILLISADLKDLRKGVRFIFQATMKEMMMNHVLQQASA